MMDSTRDYEAAIRALNGLQSNAAVMSKLRARYQLNPEVNVQETSLYLEKAGIMVRDLDRLKVIHVAGTKGKGSVCAMSEAILRNHGLKTGFYSSPHLVHVRERIRINGEPISEDQFALNFWHVYDRLSTGNDKRKIHENVDDSYPTMPAYFKFLTILAYHVFLEEKVDVAIVEVGIGGAYDCTNVLRHPVVCGITTLDYDHMSVLGNTMEEIAWQKAGIMKPGSIAVTAPQPQTCLTVLSKRAEELECPLYLCPPWPSYSCEEQLKLGIPGRQQLANASLALQLTKLWFLRRTDPLFLPDLPSSSPVVPNSPNGIPLLSSFSLTNTQKTALSGCRWPGRSQTLTRGATAFYIDGAHTPKSMQACADWFRDVTGTSWTTQTRTTLTTRASRILIFNCTSGRKPESLLEYLADLDFDCAIFCPNMVYTSVDSTADQADMRNGHEKQMEICEENRRAWLSLPSSSTTEKLHSAANGYSSTSNGTITTNGRHPDDPVALKHRLAAASHSGVSLINSTAATNGSGERRNGGNLNLVAEFADSVDWPGHYPDASRRLANFGQWTRSNGVCPATNKVTAVFPCVSSALTWLDSLEKSTAFNNNNNVNDKDNNRIQVLITGSLHLVGAVLAIIDPDLKQY